MKKYYDAAIIGGGIGGLMAAYRLIQNSPSLLVILLEKGPDLQHRRCPIITNRSDT